MTQQTKGQQMPAWGEKLNEFIRDEPILSGALVGISVRSARSGDVLYEHLGDTRLRPASNLKLLTAASALSVLGEDYTFPTELRSNGPIKGNKLHGNLYLKGKGDPTLLPEDFNSFAKKLRKMGVKAITGDIIGDDSWYDKVRLSPDLIWSDEQYYYGAQISALTASPDDDYDAGSVIVDVQPGDAAGRKPVVSVTPDTDYVKMVNKAKTVAAGEEEDITIERGHGANVITIKGTMPVGSADVREWMAVWEPTQYALDLFKQALKKNGISWTGDVKRGKIPSGTKKLFAHHSTPLSKLLIPFMKLSNNTHAEILVKEMGRVEYGQGNWEKGLAAMKETLTDIGLNPDTMVIHDGSGISHVDLIPPNEITRLLYHVQKKDWFASYFDALPIAGEEKRMTGGTLRNRMQDLQGKVHAKTGTIDGVSTLSGYVEISDGSMLVFSIMLNNLLDEEKGPAIEDRLIEIIAQK
ncbi:D-alanyl-D-alanine carboxypeptidase/D-alanyl-D-alanine-endopeptidase [Lentibacillus sp. N15]|uniref:D-alanyl-D-alanine carboxypeptidase/D-alanyl-D-alanine endopeptidase n=1 Tax=Lentibacillus songyuanensis TaxID=3136161 RepID=UPI0031B9D12B